MKKYFYLPLIVCAVFCMFFTGCALDSAAALQDLAKPYITRYECTQATLGEDDLLQQFDYIRITIIDESEMEFAYKYKGEKARAKTFGYSYDSESGEITADESALGVKIKERTVIKDGAFTVSFPLGGKELILKFKKM